MTDIPFWNSEQLDDNTCSSVLDAIHESGQVPYTGLKWLLAHCEDGITLGKWNASKSRWAMGSDAFPEISPKITKDNLLEVRIFGDRGEILIWRHSHSFRGRYLSDVQPDGNGLLSPIIEERVLMGNRLLEPSRAGFSRIASSSGAEQVVPFPLDGVLTVSRQWPLRLVVKHYLQQDESTGAIRIAATRLVDLFVKGGD